MTVARLPRKRIVMATMGQSNEVGHCQTYDGVTNVTFASQIGGCGDPVLPNGGSEGSMWPMFVDHFARDNVAVTVHNTAVGATGIVKEWCGDSVGDGSGVPFDSADGGFDPNSYFADALAEIDSGTFDEAWVTIAFGQADAGDSVSAANFQLALENATNYFLDNGAKVALGLSVVNSTVTWYEDNGLVGLTAALTTFADNPNVIAGGNLYTAFGKLEATSYLQSDGNHMIPRGYENAAKVWYDALNGTAFTQ